MYDWIKALHLLAVISWMVALLYLPRLYVYHCEVPSGSPESARFKVMERRLLRAIATPAMLVTWLAGIFLLLRGGWLVDGGFWIHVKLVLVALLTFFHMLLARWRRHFAADANSHSATFYRFANEFPTLLMILVVILAVVKPF